MPADDFGERRPRSAGRAVAVVPRVERRRQVVAARGMAEQQPLQRVHERADGELGDEPDEIGRQARDATAPVRIAS